MSSRTQPPRRATGCRAPTQAATTTTRHTTKPAAPDPPPSEDPNPTHDDPLESDYESASSEGTSDDDAIADDASPPATRRARRAALRAAVAIAKTVDASPPSATHTRRVALRAAVAIANTEAAADKLPAKRATKGNSPPAGFKAEASADVQRDGQEAAQRAGVVDAATGTVAESRVEATAIVVDGYWLDVPADPVECLNVFRREVIAAYRAVEGRRGSGRDLAVAMGTAALAGGSVGGKRGAGAWEGEERGGKRWRVKIGGRAAEEGDGGGGGEFEGIYYISKE